MQEYAAFAADAEVAKSLTAANMPAAREMQNVLLTHLLHTFKQTSGAASTADITYTATASLADAAYGDDWSQMGQMIGLAMDGADDSAAKPAFLSDATWALLVDPASDLRVALRAYLDAQYAPLAAGLASNKVALELVYACDDFNVPCAQSLALRMGDAADAAAKVTFTDNSAAVPVRLLSALGTVARILRGGRTGVAQMPPVSRRRFLNENCTGLAQIVGQL